MGKPTARQKRKCLEKTLIYLKDRFHNRDTRDLTIVGFDLSFTSSGIVELSSDGFPICELATSATTDGTHAERLDLIYRQFCEFLSTDTDIVALENISVFTQNPMSAKTLTLTLGMLLLAIRQEAPQALVVGFTTTQIKKIGTGKGKGDKNQVLKEVYKNFGIDLPSDDLADAYCAAKGAYYLVQVAKEFNPPETDKELMNYIKGKDRKTKGFLEKEGIPDYIFDVALSVSGLTGKLGLLKDNDYEFYLQVRNEVFNNGTVT